LDVLRERRNLFRFQEEKSNMMKLQIDLTSSDLHPVRGNVDSYAVEPRDTKIN